MLDLIDVDRLGLRSTTDEPEPDPKTRALAQKRKPFVCHRHGQQSGGFCRTCQRRR